MLKRLKEKAKILPRKNSRERILKDYYSRELNAGKSYKASTADELLFKFFIFIIIGIFLNHKSRTLILSFFISALTTFFLNNILVRFKRKKEYKKRLDLIEGLKKQRIIKKITGQNKSEFVDYIKELLEKYYGVEISYGDYFDLEYKVQEEKHCIRCIKLGMDERVNIREIESFNWEIKRQKINMGTIITNSYFSDEVDKEDSNILYDMDSIILILKELNLYPSVEEIEDHIIDRFNNSKNDKINNMFKLNLKKALQIYGLFAIFYLISYFVKYSLYYRVFSIGLFVITTMIIGYKTNKVFKERDYPFNKNMKS